MYSKVNAVSLFNVMIIRALGSHTLSCSPGTFFLALCPGVTLNISMPQFSQLIYSKSLLSIIEVIYNKAEKSASITYTLIDCETLVCMF